LLGTFLIDSEELKLHYILISEKNSVSEENLENFLSFISGIIKGVLAAFNVDCSVVAAFKQNAIISNIYSYGGVPANSIPISSQGQSTSYPYSFTITLLNQVV
jgi:hypothetical protein